jgi:hypothetical protein
MAMAMTHLSPESKAQLDAALTRIVDERGTDADWRVIVEYRNQFGNDAVLQAAQGAALKLRKSRTNATS